MIFITEEGLIFASLGALEVDQKGNVNAHFSQDKLSGIGGFANISQSSKKVVFCLNFSVKGLCIKVSGDNVNIIQEGKCSKFVPLVDNISFSAQNALKSGQEVLYITERCVFRLTPDGLELCETAKGIDVQHNILDQLPFPVKVAENLACMEFNV